MDFGPTTGSAAVKNLRMQKARNFLGFRVILRQDYRVSVSNADCMAVEAGSPGLVSENFLRAQAGGFELKTNVPLLESGKDSCTLGSHPRNIINLCADTSVEVRRRIGRIGHQHPYQGLLPVALKVDVAAHPVLPRHTLGVE